MKDVDWWLAGEDLAAMLRYFASRSVQRRKGLVRIHAMEFDVSELAAEPVVHDPVTGDVQAPP